MAEEEEERVYKKDYIKKPASRLCTDSEERTCPGKWLDIDGFGYYMKHCKNKLKTGDLCYYKAYCKCSRDELYCSTICCYPYQCNGCGRRSCKECYIANGNDVCSYCIYLDDDCDCLSQVDGWRTERHDKDWCTLPNERRKDVTFFSSNDSSDESSVDDDTDTITTDSSSESSISETESQ